MFQWECLAPALGFFNFKCFVAFAKSAQIINGFEAATSFSIDLPTPEGTLGSFFTQSLRCQQF